MKNKYYTILAALTLSALLLPSCKKQAAESKHQISPSSTIKLTTDEMLRLSLMNAKDRTPEQMIEGVMSIDDFATKSLSLHVQDSITFGGTTKAEGKPLIVYVVSSDNGFALTMKDEVLPPVLGYFDGEFDRDNMNPGFNIMLEYSVVQFKAYRDSIAALKNDEIYRGLETKLGLTRATKGDPDDNPAITLPPWDRNETVIVREWREEIVRTAPMLKTKWDQGWPFNAWDPNKNPAGCTAIAAAQIMAYFKHPAISPHDKQPLNWNAMITDLYGSGASHASRLSQHLGLPGLLSIDYGKDGSGANCTNTPRTFEIFGYHGGSHESYSYNSLISALSFGPVHICADDGGNWYNWQFLYTGHAWVIDGYTEYRQMRQTRIDFYYDNKKVHEINPEPSSLYGGGYFHNNFGWGGSSDGWYFIGQNMPLPECSHNIEIIYGIRPK